MSEMVTRVSTAIHKAQQSAMDRANVIGVPLRQRELDELAARAAIQAMREPTEAMVSAAVGEFKAGKSPRNILYAGIDAALKDEA